MVLVVAFITSAAIFGATTIFMYWIMSQAVASYAVGEQRIEKYVFDREAASEAGSLAALAAKLGLVFLPINEKFRDSNTFGIAQMLANWEYQLVRAGIRSQMTAEQLCGVFEVSGVVV